MMHPAVEERRRVTGSRAPIGGSGMLRLIPLLALALLAPPAALPVHAQTPTSVRDRIANRTVPPLRFRRTEPRVEQVGGVPVYFARDTSLPLVTLYAAFKGGYGRLPRSYHGAASAVPALMRNGGTIDLPPDSVDHRIEYYALQMSFGQGGGSMSAWVNTLSENLDEAAELWGGMLKSPAFDPSETEVWRGAEVERSRRRQDNPGSLAFTRFNHLMFGDHPVGWELRPEDLEPEDLRPARLQFVHRAVVCPDNLTLGVAGDLSWEDAQEVVDRLLEGWPPCSGDLLDEEPTPTLRQGPGVFVIHKDIEQAVVVLAHASPLRQADDPDYFASRVGNAILGASGLSSRLSQTLRTREGLAYSASSLWTASQRRDGLVGALTRTKPETAVAATELLLAEIARMRQAPPDPAEVSLAVDEVVEGFVFNYQSSLQVVSRAIALKNQSLPPDWLDRYMAGIQEVDPDDVQAAYRTHVDPAQMTILLVGDTTRFGDSASTLGPVTVLDVVTPSPQRESRRSRPSRATIPPARSPPPPSGPRGPRDPESP